jgi:hypothetical protein
MVDCNVDMYSAVACSSGNGIDLRERILSVRIPPECYFILFYSIKKKQVARGGERTRVLSISFIFSFFTSLPLSHSGSPRM